MHVKLLELSTRLKFMSHDWLLFDHPLITEGGSDVKTAYSSSSLDKTRSFAFFI